jgi:hypothetical protein
MSDVSVSADALMAAVVTMETIDFSFRVVTGKIREGAHLFHRYPDPNSDDARMIIETLRFLQAICFRHTVR